MYVPVSSFSGDGRDSHFYHEGYREGLPITIFVCLVDVINKNTIADRRMLVRTPEVSDRS